MAAAVHLHFPHLFSLLGGFSSSHVRMWQLDHKESWAPKKWCFWTVVLEKTLESPLDCKEIQPLHPKRNPSWIFTGRTDAENWNSNTLARCEELTPWKRPWCWERLKTGEGEDRGRDGWMASLTQWTWVWATSGRKWRTGGLACCSPWGRKEQQDWCTEQQNKLIFTKWQSRFFFWMIQWMLAIWSLVPLHFLNLA